MIKFSIPTMTGDEEKYIMEVFHHKTSSTEGSFINRCNAWFEEKTGTPKALLTGSCTHALEWRLVIVDESTSAMRSYLIDSASARSRRINSARTRSRSPLLSCRSAAFRDDWQRAR